MDRATFERDAAAHLDWCAFVTLVFSAKESLYKCLQPLTGVFFDFADAAVVEADVGQRTLRLRLLRRLSDEHDRGRELRASFSFSDGHVYTLVSLAS
jgi:enterobactin synthetase component D